MPEINRHIDYSDGTFALIFAPIKAVQIKNKETNQEEDYYEFIVKPTPITVKKWGISEKDKNFINKGDYAGNYRCYYKKDYCFPLDPNSRTWLLTCDYKGTFIDLPNTILGFWKDKLENIKKQNKSLQGQISSLTVELIKASTNPSLWKKKLLRKHREEVEEGTIIAGVPQPEGDEVGKG